MTDSRFRRSRRVPGVLGRGALRVVGVHERALHLVHAFQVLLEQQARVVRLAQGRLRRHHHLRLDHHALATVVRANHVHVENEAPRRSDIPFGQRRGRRRTFETLAVVAAFVVGASRRRKKRASPLLHLRPNLRSCLPRGSLADQLGDVVPGLHAPPHEHRDGDDEASQRVGEPRRRRPTLRFLGSRDGVRGGGSERGEQSHAVGQRVRGVVRGECLDGGRDEPVGRAFASCERDARGEEREFGGDDAE